MLTAENATKVPSSPASLPFSLSSAVPLLSPQSFVLEAKVKKEKMGCDSANGSNRGTHDVNHIIFPEKQIKTFFISHN